MLSTDVVRNAALGRSEINAGTSMPNILAVHCGVTPLAPYRTPRRVVLGEFYRRILGLQGRDQREKVVHRWRTRRRFASYPILESETAYAVEENLSLTIAVAQPGQSRTTS